MGEADRFGDEFDDEFAVGPEDGNRAFFGRDVLRGLVEGIDDFIHTRQARWKRFRSFGPVLLGSAMWIDDEALIGQVERLSGACIIVTKQRRRSEADWRKLQPLIELNTRTPGLPTRAFTELQDVLPKVDGAPAVTGPSTTLGSQLPTIRTIGYRRTSRHLAPILHAKLALLGHLWWHDEGPMGVVDDVIGFAPGRLWVSSANFTRASRESLEVGHWTEDRSLLQGAARFLIELMRSSEGLDPAADSSDPDLAPYEFDDEAMAEAAAGTDWDDD